MSEYDGKHDIKIIIRIRELESQNAELYEALRQAAEWLPYHEPDHPDYEGAKSNVGRHARDVLAKARGGDNA